MPKMIFVNLRISDGDRRRAFFSGLGYGFNEQFSDDKGLSMVISENLITKLVKPEFSNKYLDKPTGDPMQALTNIISLSFDTRDVEIAHHEKAFELGAGKYKEPVNMGCMWQWSSEDLDGNKLGSLLDESGQRPKVACQRGKCV